MNASPAGSALLFLATLVVVVADDPVIAADSAVAADPTLGESGDLPEGPSEAIAKMLDPKGVALVVGEEIVARFWFAREPTLSPVPSTALGVNYRFANGQLIGLLQVTGKGELGDFRDQPVKPGVYTLRYGLQPEDGNHIGTSDTADFLLALPTALDRTPPPLNFAKLTTTSAKSVASAHPAIFSMLSPGKPPERPTLTEQREFHVLEVPLAGRMGDKPVPVGLRVVVIGHGDE